MFRLDAELKMLFSSRDDMGLGYEIVSFLINLLVADTGFSENLAFFDVLICLSLALLYISPSGDARFFIFTLDTSW
jgi:hypothetical protein